MAMKDQAGDLAPLKKTIQEIQNNVKESPYDDPNEQSIKQGIILPILRDLSWPIHDPKIVYPEYSVEGGRIDYALCDHNRPVMLIEAKRYKRLDGAEWQVFQYSLHVGTPIAILTDGLEWRFFMPGEEGAYYERLLCTVNLMDENIDQVLQLLHKYLSYENVMSRRSIEEARIDYRNRRKDLKFVGSMPDVSINPAMKSRDNRSKTVSRCRFILKGKEFVTKNRQEAAAIMLNTLADDDQSILDKIAELPRHGSNRRYLAKSSAEVYPDDPIRSAQKTFQFRPGWYIPGGLGTRTLRKIVEMICNSGNLVYGKDIILVE